MSTVKKILIIGGTGSLGVELTKRYLSDESMAVYLYSRDESKHWAMDIEFNHHPNLRFIIGNIADREKIKQTIVRHNVDIIILAAAMKHIDLCEYETNECIHTNMLGTKIVLDEIEHNQMALSRLTHVCFVSTDKACSPVSMYGITKAASECLMVEKSKHIPHIKFVCVRYGNVLNSRGSIIPMLHTMGQSPHVAAFTLTDERMTRFVMTLEQSVDLIEHALQFAESGDIVIPKLVSCRVKDLIEMFAEKYRKPIQQGTLRPGEKMLESLINETQSLRLVHGPNGYSYIKPAHNMPRPASQSEPVNYNSTLNPLSKEELRAFLQRLQLL